MKRWIEYLLETEPEQKLTSWLFLRLLAIVYFIAFASLSVQIVGLVGPDGILPFEQAAQEGLARFGSRAWWMFPSIFWLDASDAALQCATWAGALLSIVVFLGYWQRTALTLMFVLYVSLLTAGQTFLTFQWDILLLESGFFAIFLASNPSRLVIFFFHWLLFRLRFLSGLSKILSGDPSWANLTALNYYFEAQPLPHVGSWYAHHLPEAVLRFGTGFTLFAELIVPFFIFMPRPFRITAAIITTILQLLIIATSNHNWINILTIVLCIFLLDDRIVSRVMPRTLVKAIIERTPRIRWPSGVALMAFGFAVFATSLASFYVRVLGQPVPPAVEFPADVVRHYGLGHIYHVFPTMQTERQELEIIGSMDGRHWMPYLFKYKPGPLDRAPKFNVPHQPRLDWQMWFVPPHFPDQMEWFDRFMEKLAHGEKEVTALLEKNPFPDRPPRFLRVAVWRYHYTTPAEREQTGNWWKREFLGFYPDTRPRRP